MYHQANWQLTIEEDGAAMRTLGLDPAKVYSIGRGPGCDVGLTDRNVSRDHARLA